MTDPTTPAQASSSLASAFAGVYITDWQIVRIERETIKITGIERTIWTQPDDSQLVCINSRGSFCCSRESLRVLIEHGAKMLKSWEEVDKNVPKPNFTPEPGKVN